MIVLHTERIFFFSNFRENVLESIPNILTSLEKWQETNQTLAQAEGNLQEGHQLMAMIKVRKKNSPFRLSISCTLSKVLDFQTSSFHTNENKKKINFIAQNTLYIHCKITDFFLSTLQ